MARTKPNETRPSATPAAAGAARTKRASARRTRTDAVGSHPLWARPGFLVRRLHQIHTALFLEETAKWSVTPVQFSLLTTLADHPAIDQATLSMEIGLDRTSVAEVLARLERDGLVRRDASNTDRRVKLVSLAPRGRALLEKMSHAALRAHDRTIAALPAVERREFLRMLMHLVNANNAVGRAPFALK